MALVCVIDIKHSVLDFQARKEGKTVACFPKASPVKMDRNG